MSNRGCLRGLGSLFAVVLYASIWIAFDRYHRGAHVEETLTVLGGETVRVGDLVKAARGAASIGQDRTTDWECCAFGGAHIWRGWATAAARRIEEKGVTLRYVYQLV
jgi:hypothetical protein